MKTFCKNRWRISAITKDNSGYCFFSNGVKVYHLSYGNVTGWIPPVSADTLPWQYPVLSVEVYENGEYYQTTLDGRPIKTDKYLAPLEKFVAHYPEKPDLEDEINRLPLLYRPGLKALLYLKLRKPADKSYLSLLLWLNQAAAKVYKRYNAIKLSYSAVWYNQHEDWKEIKAAGLKAVMEAQAHIEPRFLTIEDYLEQLGVYDIDELSEDELEIVTELVCYMIKVNTAVAQEQNRVWKSFGAPRELSEQAEKKAYLESLKGTSAENWKDYHTKLLPVYEDWKKPDFAKTETWKYQDMLSRGNLTEKDMENFFRLYQI